VSEALGHNVLPGGARDSLSCGLLAAITLGSAERLPADKAEPVREGYSACGVEGDQRDAAASALFCRYAPAGSRKTAAIRRCVYSCCGFEQICEVVPHSTISP